MFASSAVPVSTVTPLFGVSQFDFASASLAKMHHRIYSALSENKRADASMPNTKVRELLLLARSRGMTQKDFEIASGRIHANTATKNLMGFNGRLWHYYTTTNASMKCISFTEYAQEFHSRGWIGDRLRDFMREALSVQIIAKLGRPATVDELESKLAAAWLEATIAKLCPNMPARVRGTVMRKLTSLPPEDQAEAAREAVNEIQMMHALGKKIEQRDGGKFGTILSH
jgi:hypothetical protein